jgi:FkbM family methyltransferase
MRADSAVPVPSFVAEFRDDYGRNLTRWRELEASLADAESKSVLDALTRFRLSADYRYMASFSVRFDEQYFDPIIALSGSEVFVDCGGYDGDTVLEFLRRVESYERIYMFEPSPVNFGRARVRLDAIRDVELVPLGVSDSQSTLSFDAGAGSASAVSESGSTTISVVSIDDYVARPVTYIKMDLEGWELRALMGAKRHIVEDHPKLAVAVYHAAPDFWKVRETVLGLRGDYEIYLRHYSEGWSETIMYFIPH